MPKAKEVRMTIRPNNKLRLYLEELGFIDRRNGNIKRNSNFNEFVNEALIMTLETTKHSRSNISSNEDLMGAWRKYQIALRTREIDRLRQEQSTIVNWKG